jgi:phage tail-like protein
MRAPNFIFTVSVGSDERQLTAVTGLGNEIDVVDFRESDRAPVFKQPGKLSGSNITLRGVPIKLWDKEGPLASMFKVFLDGTYVGRCRRLSGLGVKINVYESVESDNIIKHKLPGHLEYNEVTLQQILDTDDKALATWVRSLGYPKGPGDGFAVGSAVKLQDAKHNLDVHILARDQEILATVKLQDCWPSRWNLGDLDVSSEDLLTQELTLQVNGYVESNLGNDELTQWFTNALKCKPEKRTLIVRAYERCAKVGADAPVATWKVINAWPSEIGFADLDAGSTDVWIREVVVACEGVNPIPG